MKTPKQYDRYEIISRTYHDNFKFCIILILDKRTGEIKKEIIKI